MFIPNISCVIRKKGRPDVFGQAGTAADFPEKCAIVKAKYESAHTTVRADSGASRSHADEFVTSNRFLVSTKTNAGIDDQIDVIGYKIRIKVLQPRFNVLGEMDHYEIEGELWG